MRASIAILIAVTLCGVALKAQANVSADRTDVEVHNKQNQHVFGFLKANSMGKGSGESSDSSKSDSNESDSKPKSSESNESDSNSSEKSSESNESDSNSSEKSSESKESGEGGGRPTTKRPSTSRPTTRRPTTERPTTRQPSTERPTTRQPSTERPTTRQPSTDRPTTTPPNNECNIVCPADPEDQYLPNPVDCTSYIQCSNGVPIVKPCPVGLVFDPTLNVCNYPADAPPCKPISCSKLMLHYRVGNEWFSKVARNVLK